LFGGVNYFADERLCGGRIFWDKEVPQDYTKSKGEIAYKSFGVGVDYIKVVWHGMLQYNMKDKEERIHPTQKPILLYKQLLAKYAKEGNKILDTHLGSGGVGIACYDMGFDLTATEIDKEYFEKASKRIDMHKRQLTLF
jgi:site-specific DNA-methyltransferase (adenine-specific)